MRSLGSLGSLFKPSGRRGFQTIGWQGFRVELDQAKVDRARVVLVVPPEHVDEVLEKLDGPVHVVTAPEDVPRPWKRALLYAFPGNEPLLDAVRARWGRSRLKPRLVNRSRGAL